MRRVSSLVERWSTAFQKDDGAGLVELMLAMVIAGALSLMMVVWIGAAFSANETHLQDDVAVQDLRVVRERLGREVREARSVLTADSDELAIWLDEDRDGTVDQGESVSWSIIDDTLVRSTDATSLVIATGVSSVRSSFEYAQDAGDVTTVSVSVVIPLDSGAVHSLSLDIPLRNKRDT